MINRCIRILLFVLCIIAAYKIIRYEIYSYQCLQAGNSEEVCG
jgi:hypothetical protein